MLGVMLMMLVSGRSALAAIGAVAVLWIVALSRASAARRSAGAREFLLDILAMALVVVVTLARGAHGSSPLGAVMTGMSNVPGGTPGGVADVAPVIIVAWALARIRLGLVPGTLSARVGSVMSGSCCAVGLVAMLLM